MSDDLLMMFRNDVKLLDKKNIELEKENIRIMQKVRLTMDALNYAKDTLDSLLDYELQIKSAIGKIEEALEEIDVRK